MMSRYFLDELSLTKGNKMKLLQISEEIEKSIVTLFDVALKSGGVSVLAHIDAIRNAVTGSHPPVVAPVADPVVPVVKPSAVE